MVVSPPSTQLTSQDSDRLKRVWETIDADSCPYTYNFHMHTICSDGQLTPLALIEQAANIGLKGMAITDHHSVRGYQAAQDWLVRITQQSEQVSLPHLWTGVEITASLEGVEVHILGYAFAPENLAIKPYLQRKSPEGENAAAKRVIASIHQAGGLAVLAHPARYRRPAQELIPLAANFDIDGVEAYYAYTNPQPWQTSPVQTKQVKQLALEYNLFTTCGTDTHGLNLLRRI
ncbi:PHP domain-containing protein [Pleurocapsales cyanobacterium LEGE 06147]|nr:PHP domain-containing protein [Pleurocapsales cyanobacterium LEGE 06147]